MEHLHQSPTDPGFVQDPNPFYARARAAGPLVWWKEYGMVIATRHAAVGAIMRDRRFGREAPSETHTSPPPHTAPFYALENHSMLELEPPRHTRLRSLVLRAFTARRIEHLGPEIETLAQQLIDGFPNGPFDLIETFAKPLPAIVIARLLGVPEAMAPDLLRWSNAMVRMYMAGRTRADEGAATTAAIEFSGFLRGHVDRRRTDPRDDLITHLVAAEQDGQKLSTDELISTCILLLNAGHEATVHTLGNGVKTLLELGHSKAPMTGSLVEEVLRYDPPLHMFTRWVYEDAEIGGHTFHRGDQVGLLLGSTGRDAAIYEDPDLFDPNRVVKQHHAFGVGIHFCLGAPLARLELQMALHTLFARCPDLAIAEPPRYADIYHFHGLERLMVVR